MKKLRLEYNSPVILTYTLIATIVMGIDTVFTGFTKQFFAFRPVFEFANPLDYFRLVSHAIGHANWAHLAGNFAIILLIGPILEEKHGWRDLLFMILVTAVSSAALAVLLFDHYGLGASGVVFMLIILASFTNLRAGTIPLTFVLVAALYLGQEVWASFRDDNVSQFAHIMGGIIGGSFGFMLAKKAPEAPETPQTPKLPG